LQFLQQVIKLRKALYSPALIMQKEFSPMENDSVLFNDAIYSRWNNSMGLEAMLKSNPTFVEISYNDTVG
jgi:hypothetical protein